MFRRLGRYFIALAIALVTLSADAVFAENGCEASKSLFVNISSDRPNAVQVALLVAFANAGPECFPGEEPPECFGGQEAQVQLFFADAAASYAIDTSTLTKRQLRKLRNYLRKEFGYRIDDVLRLQGPANMDDPDLNGELPDIRTLQLFGTRVFGCSLCLAEALTAAGVEGIDPNDPTTLMPYLLPDAEIIAPSEFYVLYDRTEEQRGSTCPDVTASAISF